MLENAVEFETNDIALLCEEFCKTTNDDLLTRANNIKYIGKGGSGIAYRIGDKTLKITIDEDEASNAILIKNNPHPCVYRVRSVFAFKKNSQTMYAILYDYLDSLTRTQRRSVKALCETFESVESPTSLLSNWPSPEKLLSTIELALQTNKSASYKRSIRSALKRFFKEPALLELLEFLTYSLPSIEEKRLIFGNICQVVSGVQHLLSLSTPTIEWLGDLHVDNVLRTKDNQLVVIDIGLIKLQKQNILEQAIPLLTPYD